MTRLLGQLPVIGVQRAIELEDLRLHRSYSILGNQIAMKGPASSSPTGTS